MAFRPTRRAVLASGLASGAFALFPGIAGAAASRGLRFGQTEPVSLDRLKGMAESLAGQPYRPTPIADAE
ncbi:MAG: hypothetical protein AB7L41_14895, partial [Flavobacteriaceae bacterium]